MLQHFTGRSREQVPEGSCYRTKSAGDLEMWTTVGPRGSPPSGMSFKLSIGPRGSRATKKTVLKHNPNMRSMVDNQ